MGGNRKGTPDSSCRQNLGGELTDRTSCRSFTIKPFSTRHRRIHDRGLLPQPTSCVLGDRHGFWYQAGILAELAAEVFTDSKNIAPLRKKKAEATHYKSGIKTLHVKDGDGGQGLPEMRRSTP